MILYLDASALVKLYAGEPGRETVRQAVESASACYTHLIAYAEVRAALARAMRSGRITATGLVRLRRELERDWRNLDVIQTDETLIRRAGDLAEQYGLRGYDSVHLAAAETLKRLAGPRIDCCFAVFDRVLADAGLVLGLQPLDDR